MKSICLTKVVVLIVFLSSCKFVPSDNSKHENFLKEGPGYKILLNPPNGSTYKYNVVNETSTSMKVNDKEIDNQSNTTTELVYDVSRDTVGDILLKTGYEKIKMLTKNGDNETELDADNATYSTNPIEKLLGALKLSKIEVYLKPNGTLKKINGFKELSDQVFSQLKFTDANTAAIAREQWDKTIEGTLVKQNVEQFFKIFPDSIVHLREKWKIVTIRDGEYRLKITTTYFVKAITETEVFIESNSEVVSLNEENKGQGSTISESDLSGSQDGEYVLDINTGMLKKAELSSKIEGSVVAKGLKVPLKIKSKVVLKGDKI